MTEAQPTSEQIEAVALTSISTDEWSKLPEREQSLQSIGDAIAYWIRWGIGDMKAEGINPADEHYIILDGNNAPPHWPSIRVLTNWLSVIRAHDTARNLIEPRP